MCHVLSSTGNSSRHNDQHLLRHKVALCYPWTVMLGPLLSPLKVPPRQGIHIVQRNGVVSTVSVKYLLKMSNFRLPLTLS